MAKEPQVEALWISGCAKDEAPQCEKMLLLGIRRDGTSYSRDTGLTADEAEQMAWDFIQWVRDCLRAADKTIKE